jgi:tripartite ATP-independent transporter DctP family solute receptor
MSKRPEGDPSHPERILELPSSSGLLWLWLVLSVICLAYGTYLILLTVDPQAPVSLRLSGGEASSSAPAQQLTPDVGQAIIACVDSPASSFAWAGRTLSQRIEKATGGRIKLGNATDGLVNGRKYDELGLIHEVQLGHIAMAIVTSSPLSNIDPDYDVFDLPFLFRNEAEADKVLLGPVGRGLMNGLEKNEMKGLGSFELGFRIFSTAVPMPTLADFKNKKIRVMQSSTSIAMVRLLGCEPVASAVDKIYQMGKQGYIDGADRTYPTYWDFKLYEVERYVTQTYHSYPIKVLIANQRWFASLAKNEQEAILDAVPRVEVEQRQHQRAEERRVIKQCLSRGIKIFELSSSERERFRQACQPLYGEYEKLRGGYILQEVKLITNPENP